ncbi:DUF3352 domain-containing protein [Leptothoe kymatousa]|uniref:DUF3352 domain-containing protein n=1 Tax=Leptothoe kymatousa TAU-MAC 1615 TaxID=2364775 RepID=A0ABS5XZA6_9CYAN|nr:DUF3352 domain-containing protein [Leptothoe kymatousa]MBT9310711.1 DUF3352 domain-containing protein [Leptothoe kymatousa TAU-MAC 1615]
MMRKLVAIAFVCISLVIVGCGQLSPVSPQNSASQNNAVLEFIPRQALLATVIDASNAGLPSALSKILPGSLTALLEPLAIDFDNDVRPWLGNNMAFAVTDSDVDRDRSNGRQTGYLWVAEIADSERLREFLELFWQRQSVAGIELEFAQTNGVPLIAGTASADQSLVTAIVDKRTLLVANDPQVLRQSLRVSQAPQLQMPERNCCQPIWLTLRIPGVIDWLGLALPKEQQFLTADHWQQLWALGEISPQGLAINTQLATLGQVRSGADAPVTDSVSADMSPQQYMPPSMAWVALGHDLQPLWLNIQNELSHYEKLPLPLRSLTQWTTTQLGQKIAAPIRQLLAHDYSVGQLDDGSWVMAVSNADAKNVANLDQLAADEGLTVSQLTLGGHTVTAWSRLTTRLSQDARNRETTVETDLVALHTKVDDCDVFTTSLASLTAALDAPGHALTSTQRFQRTVQIMDTPNQGYIYGTWNDMERLLASNRWFTLVQPILQPWTQSIDAIAITSYIQTTNQSTGTVSVLLKK